MSARPRSRKAYHHGDLRRALIDAALEMVAEGDIKGLSLRALARRVGVTYAAPYHHFKDKNELFAELAAEGFREMRAEMEQQKAALPADADPIARLGAEGRGYFLFAVTHPAHYRVMFRRDLADRDAYPVVHDEAEGCYEKLLEVVTEILPEDATEDDVQALATTVWSTVHGAATLWNDGGLDQKMEGVSKEEMAALITRQIGTMLRGALRTRLGSTG